METVFVLFLDNHFEGVFTTHMKATQAIWMHAVPKQWRMTDYSFQFGTEFFTYENNEHDEMTYTLMEVTPNERA